MIWIHWQNDLNYQNVPLIGTQPKEAIMSMTRRDYVKIAEVVDRYRTAWQEHDYVDFVHDLCVIFEADNDRFDPDRFKKATKVI